MSGQEHNYNFNITERFTQDRGHSLRSFCVIFMVLPAFSVLFRFWSRAVASRRGHKYSYDDYLCMASLPFVLAQGALTLHWVNLGLGKHLVSVEISKMIDGFRMMYCTYYIYAFAVGLPKISALLFYCRLFWPTSILFNINVGVICVLNTLWIIVVVISATFLCTVTKAAWPPIANGRCLGVYNWNIGVSTTSVLLDLWILLLPLPILWSLNTKLVPRLLVMGVFICGYCVIVVSVGRLVAISKFGSGLNYDLTWNFSTPMFWLTCEGPISVIGICLPNSFNLFRRVYQYGTASLFTDKEYATPNGGSGHSNNSIVNPARKFQKLKGPNSMGDTICDDEEVCVAPKQWFEMHPIACSSPGHNVTEVCSGPSSAGLATEAQRSNSEGADPKAVEAVIGSDADSNILMQKEIDVIEQRRWTVV